MNANRISIDYANNDGLKEVFAHKQAGDTCKLTIHSKVIKADENGAELAIKKIVVPEDYGRTKTDEDDGSIRPDSDEPAMIVMGGMKHAEGGDSGGY